MDDDLIVTGQPCRLSHFKSKQETGRQPFARQGDVVLGMLTKEHSQLAQTSRRRAAGSRRVLGKQSLTQKSAIACLWAAREHLQTK
jgi:hypothetical protein